MCQLIANAYGYKPFAENQFIDISNSYAKKSITALANHGIISGVDKNHFMPHKNTTRVEAISILHRILSK